jgi:dihydrolipoamide dehydrogenase
MAQQFDCVVIGGGPGGYVCAIRAAQNGLKVALVEEKHLGGICLNWGCIPTKALLKSAELVESLKTLNDFGIQVSAPTIDAARVVQRSRDVAGQLSNGIKHLLKKNKVTVVEGRAQLAKPSGGFHQLMVAGKEPLQAQSVVLATGASARVLPGFDGGQPTIWTYREAMTPKAFPKSLIILGSGAIGIEFASFYQAMGTQVTVVEIQPRILPAEDAEIAQLAHKALEKRGIVIKTESTVTLKEATSKNCTVDLVHQGSTQTFTVDAVLVAVGVQGNIHHLGLENTQVQTEKSQIVVNSLCQTHERGIYAIGDVAGAPWLAHKASHEGILVADHMAAGKPVHPLNRQQIPGCTYSDPQIASIGLTEEKAKAAGIPIRVGRFPFQGNGKALASGKAAGLIKVIFHETTGQLVGAHMIGPM